MDSHPSNAINGLRDLNPAVLQEDPRRMDPSLDPHSIANGFNPKGSSKYTVEFQRRYFKAQAERMNRLIDSAKARLAAAKSGAGPYPDDDAFIVPRAEGGRLIHLDTGIHARTLKAQKHLRNDGSIAHEIVQTVRPPQPEAAQENATFSVGARFVTLRSFLSANAVRANDSMEDIDWCSTNTSVRCALGVISVPVLFTAMSAAPLMRDQESHYEAAVTRDKDFVIIEGATHGGYPCVPCERTPGQYSNTERNHYNYIARWITERFPRS